MKTQKYLITIEMPDGDMISPSWIQELIQADCDVEDKGRQKVLVEEIKQEVDLKNQIQEWVELMVGASFPEQDGDFISEEDYRSVIRQTACHFYELGKTVNAMDKIARIRQEIERHKQAIRVLNEHTAHEQTSKTCAIFQYSDTILSDLLAFIDTLPDEERPEGIEPYNPGYDEAYLNEKIVKASDAWKGVDVDKYLDEVRGGDKAEHFLGITKMMDGTLDEAAEEYASDYPAYNDEQAIAKYAFKRGAEWQKAQMMKEAVEGEIVRDIHNLLHIKSAPLPMPSEYHFGDKVKIIILPDETDND